MVSWKSQREAVWDLWLFGSVNTEREGEEGGGGGWTLTGFSDPHSAQTCALAPEQEHGSGPGCQTLLIPALAFSEPLMWFDLVPPFCTISSLLFVNQACCTRRAASARWK